MLGLAFGELFVITFVVVAVLTARWTLELGGALGASLAAGKRGSSDAESASKRPPDARA